MSDDQFEGDESEQTVSIQEYLKDFEEQELFERCSQQAIRVCSENGACHNKETQEVDLVLGGDEGKECTYENGYMKRQVIFSCLTCTPDGNAGVCTACSPACHDGHELWTKRNFRCDCGNSNFGEFYCRFLPSKDVENEENSYNHNFKGLYCTYGQPYPDPNVEEQVVMIQYCICEHWFHEEHLGMESCNEHWLAKSSSRTFAEDVTVKSDPGASSSGAYITGVDLSSTLPTLEQQKPMFLSKGGRDVLCRCKKCLEYYSTKKIAYLLEKEDSIAEYEKVAKEKRAEQQEGNELNLLNKLGHVEKMEILSGIADMKTEFLSFMNNFDSSKTVTTDDIQQVFENLAKKRRRTDCLPSLDLDASEDIYIIYGLLSKLEYLDYMYRVCDSDRKTLSSICKFILTKCPPLEVLFANANSISSKVALA